MHKQRNRTLDYKAVKGKDKRAGKKKQELREFLAAEFEKRYATSR